MMSGFGSMGILGIGSCAFEIDHALQNPCRLNGNILGGRFGFAPCGWLLYSGASASLFYTYIQVEPGSDNRGALAVSDDSIQAIIQSELCRLRASIFIDLAPDSFQKWF